jgi:aspartyl-tRNA(Asn)/glutamyl-tRNA(Gln) amidotransferase subunit A
VGLKPTNGLVSNRGVIPNSWTFDTVGPMTKTVEDAALMLQAIAGYDELDPSSIDRAVLDFRRGIGQPASNLRVGIPRTPYFENLDPEVASAVETALEVIRELAADLREVEIPPSPGLGISSAEIYAYHAPWITETPQLYQPPTRRIVQAGADARTAAYIDGVRDVSRARRAIVGSVESIDLVVMPSTGGVAGPIPPPPPEAGEDEAPGARGGRGGQGGGGRGGGGGPSGFRNTSYFSYYGLPAISVPCGFTIEGLPIGIEIGGAPFSEATVLALAHAYEQVTDFHTRRPNLPV